MQPRFYRARKDYRRMAGSVLRPVQPGDPKISIRMALVVLLAQYAALADAALLYVARQAVPLILVTAAAAFAAAYHFFDDVIERG